MVIAKEEAREFFRGYEKEHREERVKQGKEVMSNFLHRDLFGPP